MKEAGQASTPAAAVVSFEDDVAVDIRDEDAAIAIRRPLIERSTTASSIVPDDDPIEETHSQGHSGVMQTTYNVINIFMGVGLLSMAYTLQLGGWVSLIPLYAALALFLLSARLLVACFDMLPPGVPHTYPQLGESALGSKLGRGVVTCFAFTEFFGGSCMQQIVMWQQLSQLLPGTVMGVTGFRFAQIVASIAWTPLMFVRDFRSLSYTSAVGFASTVGVTIAVIVAVAIDPARTGYDPQPAPEHQFFAWGIVQASGIYAVSVSGHSGLPSLRNSMKQPSRFGEVLALAFGSMALIYSLVAVLGYYYFGVDSTALITHDLNMHSLLGRYHLGGHNIVHLLGMFILVNVFTTLPVIVMAQQDILMSAVAPDKTKCQTPRTMHKASATVLRLVIFFVTLGLSALAADMLGVVESLVGGFCSLNCSLLMPAIFYMLLSWRRVGGAKRAGLVALTVFCIVAMIVIVGQDVINLVAPPPQPAAGGNALGGNAFGAVPWQSFGIS